MSSVLIPAFNLSKEPLDWHHMDAKLSDENLMKNYAAGDQHAFEELYTRHKGAVFRYFLRQCSDQGTAEELYQDVWVKLINAKANYKPEAKFTTWLFTLAHNHLVDWYRKQGRKLDKVSANDEIPEVTAHENWQPENDFERKRLGKALTEAVMKLPNEQSEVFLMHQEGGLTVKEIAEILNISHEAAKSRYRYATKKLRQRLEAVKRL